MSETTAETTATVTEAQPEQDATEAAAKAEVDWKAKSREWEKRAKENAKAAERLAQLEESQKTEAQKIAERAEAAERRATEAERAALRYRVAVQKKLPPELVDRLRGDTEEEMAADADALLELVSKSATPAFNAGPRTTATAPNDMNALIRRAAGHG